MVQNATVPQQNDRVSFSFGMKLSLPTKYESADFHISLTSDVGLGENLDQALARIKAKIADEAYKLYNQIRDSETGLLGEQSKNTGNVSTPAKVQTEQTVPSKAKDTKVLRQQIKSAYAVLEAQKKITKTDFVTQYLLGKKTDELKDEEVNQVINKLKTNFKELGL